MADEPLKVLLLAGRFAVRGSSARTLHLAEQLPAQGVESRIVCLDATQISPQRRRKIPIVVMPQLNTPLLRHLYHRFLLRDLSKDPPDVIHVQWRGMLPLGTWLARRLQRPYVITVHDYLQPRESLVLDPRWGRRVIAVSHSVGQELIPRTGLRADQLTVIHSGVRVDDEPKGLSVLDTDHVPTIGTAGPLEAAKGHTFFLRAARIVHETRPDAQFLIAGAGPEEHRLRRLTQELQLTSQVTFVPNMFDFSDSLSAMDIFCLPALKQGLGTTMLEAMARGKPVIATRAGGVDAVVCDGETGLLVPPSDSPALAAAILELLCDPLRARGIGQHGRELVAHSFRIDDMVRMTAELYRKVHADSPHEVGAVQGAAS